MDKPQKETANTYKGKVQDYNNNWTGEKQVEKLA